VDAIIIRPSARIAHRGISRRATVFVPACLRKSVCAHPHLGSGAPLPSRIRTPAVGVFCFRRAPQTSKAVCRSRSHCTSHRMKVWFTAASLPLWPTLQADQLPLSSVLALAWIHILAHFSPLSSPGDPRARFGPFTEQCWRRALRLSLTSRARGNGSDMRPSRLSQLGYPPDRCGLSRRRVTWNLAFVAQGLGGFLHQVCHWVPGWAAGEASLHPEQTRETVPGLSRAHGRDRHFHGCEQVEEEAGRPCDWVF